MATAAPAKPWERARGGSAHSALGGGSAARPLVSVSPLGTTAAAAPPVPPRSTDQNTPTAAGAVAAPGAATATTALQPSVLGSSTPLFGTGGLGGYGGYGGYGGTGGLFGGGGYRGGFGSYGGYGAGTSSYLGGAAGTAGAAGAESHAPTVLQSGFRLVHQITEVFGRLSYLLGVSFDSIRNSLASLIGLYEGIWPLLTAVQGLTVFRLLRALYARLRALLDWLLGRTPAAAPAPATAAAAAKTAVVSAEQLAWGDAGLAEDDADRSRPAPLAVRVLVALAVLVGVPLAVREGHRILFGRPAQKQQQKQDEMHRTVALTTATTTTNGTGGGVASVFRAKHAFENPGEGEVGFRAGECVRVLDPHAVPGQQGWARAEVGGRQGLVPLNYLTPL